MAKFETKFGVGDTVYYLFDHLDLQKYETVRDIFDVSASSIKKSVITQISFSKNNNVTYFFETGRSVSSDAEIFKTEQEAYLALLNNIKSDAQHILNLVNEAIKEAKMKKFTK